MINKAVMLIFAVLILLISIAYFRIYLKREERFMQMWGYAWIIYAVGICLYLAYTQTGNDLFLEMRKVTDMYNLICLLLGSYLISHTRVPEYWARFSLYMTLLAVVCMMYKTELLTFYLPVMIFQLAVTGFIVYNIFMRWKLKRELQILVCFVFFIWGAGKSMLSLVEVFMSDLYEHIIIELTFANILNFCILTIYTAYIKDKSEITGDLYKKVVDNSEDALFYFSHNPPAYEYISPVCRDITGYSQNDFYKNPNLLMTISQDKSVENLMYDLVENVIERGKITFQISKRDGENVWLEMKCSAIIEDNRPIAMEGVLRDVTAAHTRSMEQIKTTRSRNMLFSYISHELRTPITSVAGYITALEDGTFATDEERKEAIEIISSKTATLKKLIDDLDQMSKFETHQFTFDFQVYNVGEVVEVMVAGSIGDIEKNRFTVEFDYQDSLLSKYEFVVDLERINQVYTNLITNAIKYSGDSRRIWISFGLDDVRENFICSVKDEGVGIAGSDMNHVFDSFFRAETNTSATKYTEGRGLGLSLSREIVQRHNGQIYVDSIYGKGSVFTFTVPLFKEE